MRIEAVQRLIDKVRKPKIHPDFQNFKMPIYSVKRPQDCSLPQIYNAQGEAMELIFLRDMYYAGGVYNYPSVPTKFLFDRYNLGLKKHIYSHRAVLEKMGKPTKCYGALIESKSIVPNDYKIFIKNKHLGGGLDLVFTYDAELLNKLENARFVPFCAQAWYGDERHGGIIEEKKYLSKTKDVSFLASHKRICRLHQLRYSLAHTCKQQNLCDTYGTFDGGKSVKMSKVLDDYRYTIAIENDIQPYFFTERLTSAFLAQTIPVYLGATKISEFFNPDGIITLKEDDDIAKVLKQCTPEEYMRRLPAVLDNFERAKEYLNICDVMYEKYIKD